VPIAPTFCAGFRPALNRSEFGYSARSDAEASVPFCCESSVKDMTDT
jgi:hypothetical protein